jgi:hypothetical protein
LSETQHWVVGPEHDEKIFQRLGAALRALDFGLGEEWRAVAGSQDVSHWELHSPAGSLVIESETYVGLSVRGAAELVQRLRREFDAVR